MSKVGAAPPAAGERAAVDAADPACGEHADPGRVGGDHRRGDGRRRPAAAGEGRGEARPGGLPDGPGRCGGQCLELSLIEPDEQPPVVDRHGRGLGPGITDGRLRRRATSRLAGYGRPWLMRVNSRATTGRPPARAAATAGLTSSRWESIGRRSVAVSKAWAPAPGRARVLATRRRRRVSRTTAPVARSRSAAQPPDDHPTLRAAALRAARGRRLVPRARRRGTRRRTRRRPPSCRSPAGALVATSKRRFPASDRVSTVAPLAPRLMIAVRARSSMRSAGRAPRRAVASAAVVNRKSGWIERTSSIAVARPSASSGPVEARSRLTAAPAARASSIDRRPAVPSGRPSSE